MLTGSCIRLRQGRDPVTVGDFSIGLRRGEEQWAEITGWWWAVLHRCAQRPVAVPDVGSEL